jgi:hypothetical protein
VKPLRRAKKALNQAAKNALQSPTLIEAILTVEIATADLGAIATVVATVVVVVMADATAGVTE